MSTAELVQTLPARGVTLTPDGGSVHVDGPEAVLTGDVLARLTMRKAELLALLGAPTAVWERDPLRAWRLRNAERLTDDDRRLGHNCGGFCAEHHRWLTYPEQQRAACSWCVPVEPARETEYWASHWRRFTEGR